MAINIVALLLLAAVLLHEVVIVDAASADFLTESSRKCQ